jgi:hypothetical protein
MLTRVLNILGCALPDSIVAAGVGNETGHWEAEAIVAFDDELLASAGSRWDDWQPFNPQWAKSAISNGYRTRARDLLKREYGSFPLFVLKDPRICRLAEFWLESFASSGVEAGVVVPVRSPSDVASSLEERDDMQRGYAHLLWLRHVLDAERGSRGARRVFCTYDELFQDWRGVITRIEAGLGVVFPRNTPVVRAEIAEFIQTDRRHFAATAPAAPAEDEVLAWAAKVYEILSRWSSAGEDASDHPVLDGIRKKFDSASLAFSQLILAGSAPAGGAGAGAAKRLALEAKLAEAEGQLAEATAQLSTLPALERQESLEAAALLEARIAELTLSLDQAAQRERQVQAEAEQHAQAATSALDRAAQLDSELRQRQEEIAQTTAALADQARAQAAVAQELAAVRAALERETERATILHAEISTVKDRAFIAKSEADAVAEQNRTLLIDRADLQGRSAQAEQALRDRTLQLERVAAALQVEQAVSREVAIDRDWLRDINAAALSSPGWWRLLPAKWRARRLTSRLRHLGLFDGENYLDRYPDVRAEGMDPLRHYILHGMAEGRVR